MTEQELLPVAQTPARVDPLQYAIQHGADPATLEKLMELQERWEAGEARKAYNAAMAAFKANPPKVVKDKLVAFGTTKYRHATLANVVDKVSSALAAHGLASTWTTETDEKGAVSVTCRVTHAMGHSEQTTLKSAPDKSGQKNDIQAIGSAVTYLQRYTLLALCGLATEDDDGAGTSVEYITEAQASTIYNLCNGLGGNTEARLLKWQKVEAVEQIEAKNFDRVVAELKRQGAAK